MKFSGFVSVLLASRALGLALPEQQKSNKKITEEDVLYGLLNNPQLLSRTGYGILKERVANLASSILKRNPQMSTATIIGGIGVANAAFESLFPPPQRAPASLVKDTADFKSTRFEGAMRRKVRYGPYRLPATSEKNLESQYLHTPGMGNTFKYNARKPCDGECTVLALEMSLEHADGTPAENADGAWFHHAVLLNAGPSAKEAMCGDIPIEVLAMVGNEKGDVTFGIPNATVKAGYRLAKNDAFILNAQLMNLDDKEKFVWLTTTYDYVDGKAPEYYNSRVLWQFLSSNTAFPCIGAIKNPFGPTNLTVDLQPMSLKFSESTIPIQSPIDGVILATGGHMHDGGIGIDIYKNDEIICNSAATYTKGPGSHGHNKRAVGSGHSHGYDRRQAQGGKPILGGPASNDEIEHISDQTRCSFPNGIPVTKKDKFHITANYDFNLHPGMKNQKGELDGIMGIVGTVVAEKR